ncbi:MAG TPA: coenzyme F420-0:L-glutamate ligase, partial [Acidimicrobiia bacterium]|nr:coenzyme F420-0:L-glutamate ligase [Acidimicrobiia bacterium]
MTLTIHPLTGIPEVEHGDDLAALLLEAIHDAGLALEAGDVLVVTHKVVSKAEGAVV